MLDAAALDNDSHAPVPPAISAYLTRQAAGYQGKAIRGLLAHPLTVRPGDQTPDSRWDRVLDVPTVNAAPAPLEACK